MFFVYYIAVIYCYFFYDLPIVLSFYPSKYSPNNFYLLVFVDQYWNIAFTIIAADLFDVLVLS